MSVPSEPEKYSIDQMMDRLKNRPSEDPVQEGELVTRADGRQAIRVRTRKRRSHQPHKEERRIQRRARMIQVSGALILVMLAVFGAGFAIAFANSSPFREGLVKKITLTSGAETDLQQFRMNPTSANASALNLSWPDGNVLGNLALRGIKAEISPVSFLGKAMVGEEVTASEGTLTLRVPKAGGPTRQILAPEDKAPIRFKHYSTPKFHLVAGEAGTPNILRMRDAEASFVPENSNERPQLLLNRGVISIPGWPKLRMDRSHIEFRGDETDIIGMRFKHETDNMGAFEVSGTVTPFAVDRPSILEVQLESFLVSGIAGEELGRLFSGRIDTLSSAEPNFIAFTPASGLVPSLALSATFRNSVSAPFEVTGFPFLFGLAQTLDDEWFGRPVFDSEVHGVLRRAEGAVSIGNLNLESTGRMAIRGNVSMTTDRNLSGQLEVGVAEGTIKASENQRLDSIFGPPRYGFRWLSLKIGGNATSPADNFKNLYDGATATNSPGSPSKIPSFEDLTRPK